MRGSTNFECKAFLPQSFKGSCYQIWCIVTGGALFGSAGIEILTSKDAKKLYTQCTAAVLRMKDSVMETATTLQENCGDILADAKEINEERAAADEAAVVADEAAEDKAAE